MNRNPSWFDSSFILHPSSFILPKREVQAMIHVKKILYPTDFSSYSNQAYFHAVALAENHQASLTVLLVHTPDFKAPPQAAHLSSKEFCKAQLEQIRPVNPRMAVTHVFCEVDP